MKKSIIHHLHQYRQSMLAGMLGLVSLTGYTQQKKETADSLVLFNETVRVTVNLKTGSVDYAFESGTYFKQTTAYVEDLKAGVLSSVDFSTHHYTIDEITDPLGKGFCINLVHEDKSKPIRLLQHITMYNNLGFLLISAEAEGADESNSLVETRNISPFALVPGSGGKAWIPGAATRFIDFPFDNDNWVDVVSSNWPVDGKKIAGTSYEVAAAHDEQTKNGFVIGSLVHDFWKTGIRYVTGGSTGKIDSLLVYGGAAVKDDPGLPASYGGLDGTHDYVKHGTAKDLIVQSPLVYLAASRDVRQTFREFGQLNASIAGRLQWKGYAPVYWNSFGVEDVLGYRKVMMPAGVAKISDFIHSLDEFNKYSKPVLSIDSYESSIYTTEVLKSISRYGKKKDQQMGFYFIPFAVWTWKNSVDQSKLPGTDYALRDVVLRDEANQPIPYKNGEWGAYPIDPTHPATRNYIISQLQKAKAIDARFLKIDFLSAGALESATRYNPGTRTGMQAYNDGMKMLKTLIDSIMGPDIFITMAISPMFPHQYGHTRFVSTDVYSHLRNDQAGFPHYGSTSASMISASYLWWVQGTLWPYTNMDVAIMKNFQKNPDLNEQEIRVRLYSMITLGSILGDGSDFRNKLAAERAQRFLNNAAIAAAFANPVSFTPLRFSSGTSQSQQLSFFLPGDTLLVSAFNFDTEKKFSETFQKKELGWKDQRYRVEDLLSGNTIGFIEKTQASLVIDVPVKDAVLAKLIPVKE